VLTARDCAAILLHPDGALRSCPPGAKVVVAITKAESAAARSAADDMVSIVNSLRPDLTAFVIPTH
jgi:hypothetical protein